MTPWILCIFESITYYSVWILPVWAHATTRWCITPDVEYVADARYFWMPDSFTVPIANYLLVTTESVQWKKSPSVFCLWLAYEPKKHTQNRLLLLLQWSRMKRGYNAAGHTQNCKYRYISLLQTAAFGIDLISTTFWAWVCFSRRFFIFIIWTHILGHVSGNRVVWSSEMCLSLIFLLLVFTVTYGVCNIGTLRLKRTSACVVNFQFNISWILWSDKYFIRWWK